MTEYKLPLRNRKGEILDYCLVSQEDYEHLSKYFWSKSNNGYVKGIVNSKTWLIHRYIMINILNHDIDSHTHVDHINNNILDNCRENLRITTAHENSRNRKKVEKATSKFHYVSYYQSRKKWVARINYMGKDLKASFLNELHAAYQINLWIEEYKIPFVKKNNVELPNDFIPYKPTKTKPELPQGIYFVNKKYQVHFTYNKQFYKLGEFNTLEEAEKCKANFFKKVEEEKEAEIMSRPITRDSEGNCILQIKKENEIINILVDEEIYYDLIHYNWRIINKKYVSGKKNKKDILLSRYVMNYDGKDVIDHINGNTFDNRKCNLRIVSRHQNNMNKSKTSNASSKYIGVLFNKINKNWRSEIVFNGKNIYLGSFNNEEDAARARDTATKKYFGEFGKLNFPDE